MKPNIIFVHILKCGGTSLRHMLLEEYGADSIMPVPMGRAEGDWVYPHVMGVRPLEYQQTITPEMVEDYQVVMSHYDIRIANRLPEWHVMTMLRHPVDQLYSLFKFMTNYPVLKKMHPDIQQMEFSEWLDSGKAQPYYNTQTRYLSGHGVENKFTAISWLLNDRLTFGIVERFEESVRLFNESFGWSMTAQHLNQTSAPELTPDIRKQVEELQADDMELYRIACELFDTQFKEEPA